MIVREDYGDILASDCQTLVCPVNMVGAMGAGLALAMRNRYPGLYPEFKRVCSTGYLSPERLFIYNFSENKKILCLPTKRHWKAPSKTLWIDKSLQTLARDWEELGITSLAMPPIGCGLGKLDYQKDVRGLIHLHLGPLDLEVSIFLGREVSNERAFQKQPKQQWDRNDPQSVPW